MTIKQVIGEERYRAFNSDMVTVIDGLPDMFERIETAVQAEIDARDKEIAELEAQVPKVVKPVDVRTHEDAYGWWVLSWRCPSCNVRKQKGTDMQGELPKKDPYCSCGAKLDWTEERP